MTSTDGIGKSMDELIAYRQELLSALERLIFDLAGLVKRTPFKDWHRKVESDRHTAHQILFHLWTLEAGEFALYFRRINDEETPQLPVFDDAAWMKKHYQSKEKPRNILSDFTNLRLMEIDWLRRLPVASWSRIARHPSWGVHTLQWWVELQLEYSRQHLSDLSRILGT
jgi:hypothetical protein